MALTRTSGFQWSPPISRVNSPNRPSGRVQPVGRISASSTISASAMHSMSTVLQGVSASPSPRIPPAMATSLVPIGAL